MIVHISHLVLRHSSSFLAMFINSISVDVSIISCSSQLDMWHTFLWM